MLQYSTDPSPTLSLPASSRAFSSACRQRHSSDVSLALLHRVQPPSLQFVKPRGVPLYLEDRNPTVSSKSTTGPADLPSGHDAFIADKDRTDAPLHAVRPLRCQRCQLHEVSVPPRPETLCVEEIDPFKVVVQA